MAPDWVRPVSAWGSEDTAWRREQIAGPRPMPHNHEADMRFAMAIARKLAETAGWTDEQLREDAFVRWVAALFDARAMMEHPPQ